MVAHCIPDQVCNCTGCRSQIREIFEFKIWKEPMLVLKQIILQKKALILSCLGSEEQRRGINMELPLLPAIKNIFTSGVPMLFVGSRHGTLLLSYIYVQGVKFKLSLKAFICGIVCFRTNICFFQILNSKIFRI